MPITVVPPNNAGGGGGGTVTSVGVALPPEFDVAGSPVTSSGTITASWADEPASLVFAGPVSGAPDTPTFRPLFPDDIPGTLLTNMRDFYAEISSTTVVTVNPNASGAVNINARVGSVTHVYQNVATATITSGTDSGVAWLYVDSATGNLTLGHDLALTIIGSNLIIDTPITGNPVNAIPLWVFSIVAGEWSDKSDTRAFLSVGKKFVAGTNVMLAETSDQLTISATGSGTVTSVGVTVPSILSVSGVPITTTGTAVVTLATQTANTAWLGPASGASAAPTFRVPVFADLVNAGVAATDNNTAVGSIAGQGVLATSGAVRNTFVGFEAGVGGVVTNAADDNVGLGYRALNALTSGFSNVALGSSALLLNQNGGGNTAVGSAALRSLTSGTFNMCLGFISGFNITTGGFNVAVGAGTLQGSSGYAPVGSVAIGYNAGNACAAGSDYNTLVGYKSGTSVTSGARNTLLGPAVAGGSTGQVTTGSRNIAIGNDVAVASATTDDQLCVGNFLYGTGLTGTEGTVSSSAKLGLAVKAPTNAFSDYGNAARVWAMERHTTANTAGNTLTVSAGGATPAATDKAGGQLVLKPGVSTGAGTGTVKIQTYPGIAAATTDNTAVDAVTFAGSGAATFLTTVTTGGYTVATLPAGVIGARAYVTDALTPVYGVALVGGGAVVTPAFYTGAAWVVG